MAILGWFGTNLFQIVDCVSVHYLSFCSSSLVAFGEFTFQKFVTNQLFGLEFCAVRQDTFYPHQDYEHFNLYKKLSYYFIGWSFGNWKLAAYLQLAENCNIWTKISQNLIFYQHYRHLYDVMQREIENLEFMRGVNFEFIDSLKNDGTKYLYFFDDSCEEICNLKVFVEVATDRRHRGLSTIYIKHNLFHQSKLERDVELQNTHNILFKSPRDVMQVPTLRTQLGLGSELVDWYRDATSVPFGHILIDLCPRTDDRLRCYTNTGSIPSKFNIPDWLKQSKILDNKHTKTLYSRSVPMIFPQMQKSFPSVLPKRVYAVSLQLHSKSAQRKHLQSKKRHHVAKIHSEVRLLSPKRTTWKQTRDIPASERGLHLIKVFTSPVLDHLSWFGAVCPRSCFYLQQKLDYPVN